LVQSGASLVLSPIYADWKGMPPTLLVTSARDLLLSDTSRLQLVLQRAGVDSQLLVYEVLPHAFWYHFELPETRDALGAMAKFFEARLTRR
jgi:monoterpene epsilon-lactone hydrolase